jgi:hypothetical protein
LSGVRQRRNTLTPGTPSSNCGTRIFSKIFAGLVHWTSSGKTVL